jgi:hypothetical protein
MCTLTYLPLPASPGFILTHSRDELALRPTALPPATYLLGDEPVVYPKDPQGLGTWVATSARLSVCLLNGAFRSHVPQPPYRHSRGLVVLDAFRADGIDRFLNQYDCRGLEPFTLLLAEAGRLAELRWDGQRTHIHERDPEQPHIWSSATLYSPDVVAQRRTWFCQWLARNPAPTVADIRAFHGLAGQEDPHNALRMNRGNGLFTLSLTSIRHENRGSELLYEDLQTGQSCSLSLRIPAYAAD